MAFIPTANAAVATLKYLVSGRVVTDNISWLAAVPFTTELCSDLAGAMRDAWSELLQPFFTTVFMLTTITVVAQDSDSAPYFELPIAADNVGTGGGTPLALNTCLNIGFKTGERGRSFRGMIKHPSMATDQLATKRQWDATLADNVAQAYADWIDAITGFAEGAPAHVVISRYHDGAARAAGVATPITFYQAYLRVGTIGRRTS